MGAGSVRYAEGFGRIDGRCPAAASDQEDSHQNQYDNDGNDTVLRQRGKTLIGFQMSPVLFLPEIIILIGHGHLQPLLSLLPGRFRFKGSSASWQAQTAAYDITE
jgi:hypothetical protein